MALPLRRCLFISSLLCSHGANNRTGELRRIEVRIDHAAAECQCDVETQRRETEAERADIERRAARDTLRSIDDNVHRTQQHDIVTGRHNDTELLYSPVIVKSYLDCLVCIDCDNIIKLGHINFNALSSVLDII